MRSSVDLPEPDGPKMTTCSPACTVRSTPCSTSTVPKDFLMPVQLHDRAALPGVAPVRFGSEVIATIALSSVRSHSG